MKRPLVYLDTSTLCDAFRAQAGLKSPDSEAYRKLSMFIKRLGATGTLCVSSTHITEVCAWGDFNWAMGFAKWIDEIPYVWAKSHTVASPEEFRHQIFTKLGLASGQYCPFTMSLIAAMDVGEDITPAESAALLAAPTFSGFISATHGKMDPKLVREASLRPISALQADRQNPPPGKTAVQLQEDLARNFRVHLRKEANVLREEVVASGADVAAFFEAMDEVIRDDSALPLERLHQTVSFYLADIAAKKKTGSAKFDKQFGSTIWDMEHLVGAVYADIFSCDRLVDQAIGCFRLTRGQSQQLSVGAFQSHSAFVDAILAEFDIACAASAFQ